MWSARLYCRCVVRLVVLACAGLLALAALPAFGARSHPVRITPNPAHLRDAITFSWRTRYRSDNSLDGYRVIFSGPGGPHCTHRTSFGGYVGMQTAVTFSSRRDRNPPPQVQLSWCPGSYTGKVDFRDYPFGKTAPIIYRLVGKFRLVVR